MSLLPKFLQEDCTDYPLANFSESFCTPVWVQSRFHNNRTASPQFGQEAGFPCFPMNNKCHRLFFSISCSGLFPNLSHPHGVGQGLQSGTFAMQFLMDMYPRTASIVRIVGTRDSKGEDSIDNTPYYCKAHNHPQFLLLCHHISSRRHKGKHPRHQLAHLLLEGPQNASPESDCHHINTRSLHPTMRMNLQLQLNLNHFHGPLYFCCIQ